MLDRLIPLLSSIHPRAGETLRTLAARLPVRGAVPPTAQPGTDTRPAPMRPLHPPAATNDNPMQAVEEAVERELRASGHLR